MTASGIRKESIRQSTTRINDLETQVDEANRQIPLLQESVSVAETLRFPDLRGALTVQENRAIAAEHRVTVRLEKSAKEHVQIMDEHVNAFEDIFLGVQHNLNNSMIQINLKDEARGLLI